MPLSIPPEERKKQEYYRDARFKKYYDDVWQSTGKCVFCDLREKYVLFEEDGMVLTITLYAYIDGDMMIVPRRHVTALSDLTAREWEATRKLMYIARKLIRQTHNIRGVQFIQRHGGIQAQSTVEHLHIKCIPFDGPDLATWNYRELKHTPLENTELYKKKRKKIVAYSLKFDEKYARPTRLTLVCDAIIKNDREEVLLEERIPEQRFVPNILTLPGGTVMDFERSFEEELAREVQEETGLNIDATKLTLSQSRVSRIVRTKKETHLEVRYAAPDRFVLNTYIYEAPVPHATNLSPGDDCAKLLWVPLREVESHQHISGDVKNAIKTAKL